MPVQCFRSLANFPQAASSLCFFANSVRDIVGREIRAPQNVAGLLKQLRNACQNELQDENRLTTLGHVVA